MSDAKDAKVAYERFIGPAIDSIATDCTARMMNLAASVPLAGDAQKTDQIKWMALTLSNLKALQSHIGLIIADDATDQAKRAHAATIAKMSPERKKILGVL